MDETQLKEAEKLRSMLEQDGLKIMIQCLRCGKSNYEFLEAVKHLYCKGPKLKRHTRFNWIEMQEITITCKRCNREDDTSTIEIFIFKHKHCQEKLG